MLLVALVSGPAAAQPRAASLTPAPADSVARADSLSRWTAEAVRHVKARRHAAARALLDRVVATAPTFTHPEWGAPAFWRGRAETLQGRPAEALAAWRAGVQALLAVPDAPMDARLAAAYLRAAAAADAADEEEGALARADVTEAYLALIQRAGQAPARPWEADVLRRHIAYAALLLPPDEAARHLPPADAEQDGARPPEAGAFLAAWWRSRDPFPATDANERVEEHLRRVHHARTHYAATADPTGLDARGKVYVKFGEPYDRFDIRFDDAKFISEVIRFGVQVQRADFPDGEIWTYPHVDQTGRFVFVRPRGSDFELGAVGDLIPPQLKRIGNASRRNNNRAYSALYAMHYVFERAALRLGDYAGPYQQVDQLVVAQEAPARRLGGGTQASVGVGPTGRRLARIPNGSGFSSSVRQALNEGAQQDVRLERAREENMPAEYTEAYDQMPPLAVGARIARFLEPSGRTRTELYWATPRDALDLTSVVADSLEGTALEQAGEHCVEMALRRRTADYRPARTKRQRLLVGGARATEAIGVPPQTVVFESVPASDNLYHIDAQWDHRIATRNASGSRLDLGPLVRRSVARFDSLATLDPSPRTLEMSDLKPLYLPAGADITRVEEAPPYPFATLRQGTQLLLYFETYHLTYDADDRARYTVAYEVTQRAQTSRVARVLSGQGRKVVSTTSTTASYEAEHTRTQEYIVLDLSDLEPAPASTVEVTVRVTDETSGQEVERTIGFALREDGDGE